MTSGVQDETMDRRVRRTRSAIVSAFNRLILERGYPSLTPGRIAAAADVGRSTFYEHFRGIDDLLAKTVGAVLAPLARSCFEVHPPEEARRIVEHVWENRRFAHALFNGEAQHVILRTFATQFEAALRRFLLLGASEPSLAPELIALQLAAGQLAILGAWVSGRSGHSAQEITAALHASGRASALALLGNMNPEHRLGSLAP
jgi:AcrR family transcriptional regulator